MTSSTLVAVQLVIDEAVLASGHSYRVAIEAATVAALAGAGPGPRLIVFPEVAGHLALYALAPVRRGKTLSAVLASAAVRRPLDMLRGAVSARVLDPRHAVIAGLAPDAERYWRALFAQLARTHGAYVVAGSHLRLGADGALTNASHLIGPDGALIATTDKVNLLAGVEDAAPGGLGLSRGDAHKLPVVDTPLGKIATLIGYDAHRAPRSDEERFVAVVEQLAVRGGCTIVANPTCWRGASGLGPRASASDGLPGSLAASSFAKFGVIAHLVGDLLDQHYAGISEIVTPDGVLARAEPGGHAVASI
jgi:predicted amidohydrolase